MQGPVIKAHHPILFSIFSYKKEEKEQAKTPMSRSASGDVKHPPGLPYQFPQLQVQSLRLFEGLRLTAFSNLAEPGLEQGSILLSSVKIQPS